MNIDNQKYNNNQFKSEDFEILFRENFIPLCFYCQYKFDFTPDLSKEVVQVAFIKLWENRYSLTAGLTIKAYLYKIIDNNCIDVLKHEQVKKKYREFILDSNLNKTEGGFENITVKQLAADIHKAIEELPEQMRKIFELSRYEGLKYADIAEHLNISVKTVETQMSRALAKLRKRLAAYLPLFYLLALFFIK